MLVSPPMTQGAIKLFEGLRLSAATCEWKNEQLPACFEAPLRTLLEDVVATLATGQLPLAPTLTPFDKPDIVRPDHHRRAFYVRIPPDQGGGVIAIKGTEPFLQEEVSMMIASGLHSAWYPHRMMRLIDLYPAREFKVPLAETLREAHGDALLANELVVAYARRYGAIPALPIPLAVMRLPDAVSKSFMDLLRPELNPFPREVVELQVEKGLGCYVYYYPTAPYPRVRDVAEELDGRGPARFKALAAKEPPIVTVRRWVDLFVRILALGYLPAATTREVLGQLVKSQNVVVGGGFVDIDSARLMTDFKDWRELVEAYLFSLETFARTVGDFLFDEVSEQSTGSPFGFCLMWLSQIIGKALADDLARYGGAVDPRVMALAPMSGDLEGFLSFAEQYQGRLRSEDFDKIARSLAESKQKSR